MCGICIARRANAIDKIQHRGIESAQIAEGGWFLGHVRLPIQTEPGDGLAQPIELACLLYTSSTLRPWMSP